MYLKEKLVDEIYFRHFRFVTLSTIVFWTGYIRAQHRDGISFDDIFTILYTLYLKIDFPVSLGAIINNESLHNLIKTNFSH